MPAETTDRQYVLCLRRGRARLFYNTFQRLRSGANNYDDDEILYVAYRDGEAMAKIKAFSIFNENLGEQIRTKDVALDELLAASVNQMAKQ